MKFKFEVDDLLIVFKETKLAEEGAIVKVLDRSIDDPTTFMVVKLEDVSKARGMNDLYTRFSFWVNEDDCKKISLERPKSIWSKICDFFGR